ncbi:uncharacterized protein LOC116288367 [Actinia tenebrosa]|uniref:Uncharacterized protein LOC116288367 n=1 Tax=Actinia tenebrosa TaxID=6105 RepID=A0A6P8H3Q0_ACTTE|nr:uncharacterized protein LOC116288367 [Actinia tenebrosa]XP_031551000.1 uncharacterized protein LOC116288367 [Actinia tenebrosa]
MSYENVPCASPDTEGQEEPAPSLYSVDTHEDQIQSVKKTVSVRSRLAETANIEDHVIMNEEEIAQVRESVSRLNRKDAYVENRDFRPASTSERKNAEAHEGEKLGLEERRTNFGSFSRERWIDLANQKRSQSYGSEYNERQGRTNNAEVPYNEFAERGTSVIKRTTQEMSSENDSDSRDIKKMNPNSKEDYINLHCNESISSEDAGLSGKNANVHSNDRVYHYHRNTHEDFKNKTPVGKRDNKEDYESDSERDRASRLQGSRDMEKNLDQRAVPQVYYMQYPNLVAMSQAGGPQALGVLPTHAQMMRDQIIRARFADNRALHPSQRAEYAANRPEQQVPVASSPGDATENNGMYGVLPNHIQAAVSNNMQYVDRQGLVPPGFAVLPGIGPVRVIDGMYYQGIPMGADPSHYKENFASVPTFVPNIQGESTGMRQQRPSVPNTAKTTNTGQPSDSQASTTQEKSINNSKPFVSPHHVNPASPSTAMDESKRSESPSMSINSDRDSPLPQSVDDVDNKSQAAKSKGRPKPVSGGKPEIKCEQCGKIFGSSSALAKHKLTHSDERRYVCSICSKGFKRQDHLNGHMVTHRDKKPYECSYQDCDKSYCDMRSLRRHLENHHAANQGSSQGSRTSSPALTTTETTDTLSTANVVNVTKPGRGRPPKDRGLKHEVHDAILDHLRSGEYESGKSSGTSTPGSTHDAAYVRDQTKIVLSRERNSDSFSSTGSEEVAHVPADKGTEAMQTSAEESKPHTAIDMLKQAAERVQEHREKQSAVEHYPPTQQYMMYPEGIPYPQQWYQASVFQGQDPRFGVYTYPPMFAQQVYHGHPMIVNGQNIQRQQLAARLYAEADKHSEIVQQQQGSNASHPGKVTQQSPSIEKPSSSTTPGTFIRQAVQSTAAGTPTDPTAIAIATAKEKGQHLYTREGYYGVHPSGTQWQQVRYDESSKQYNTSDVSMGNVKTSISHVGSPSSNSSASEVDSDNIDRYPRSVHFAAGVRHDRKPVDMSYQRTDNTFHHVPEGNVIKEEQKTGNVKDASADDGIFRNPAAIVTPQRKRRPEPLKIPPSASTAYFSNHPGSPTNRNRPCSPPYTPPPMLSPRSVFSHVNAAGNLTPRSMLPQLPMTPSRLLLSSRSCRSSIDGEEESLTFPEPKINVGPQFQAKIPDRLLSKELAKNDVHKATLCWVPMDEKKKGRPEEIHAFLEMTASAAVFGGGSNKEYALHILRRTKGNIKEAVKLMLSKKYVRVPTDPMFDYHYEGSIKWSARERQSFRNAFRAKNKDFNDIQKEIGTKTVQDCVEFYYLWKANNPEAVRGRTRYIDSDSFEEDVDYDSDSETSSNPSLFECDFPQCSAKFVSRQALNGHIRVHGGSFMKPSEPRKRRNPATTSLNQDSVPVVVKKRKPYVPAPMPQPTVEGGPLPEYACKVCGRIFHKIKSRSAHMKTHVKRPDDNDKHDMQH